MPVITVDLGTIENKDVKTELIKGLTAAASAATKIPADKFIVLINEFDRDNIGVGGAVLSDLMKK